MDATLYHTTYFTPQLCSVYTFAFINLYDIELISIFQKNGRKTKTKTASYKESLTENIQEKLEKFNLI